MSRRLGSLLRVVGMAVLVGFFVWTVDTSGLRSLGTSRAALWVAAALVAHGFGNLFNSLAWRQLLNRAGAEVTLGAAVVHDLISVFWSTVLPGGVAGELVKGVRLARDAEPGAVAMTLLSARLVGGTVACLLALGCLPWSGFPLPVTTVGGAALTATSAIGVVGLGVLRAGPGALARVPWLASRVPLGRLPAGRDLAVASALSVATHATFAVMFVLCFGAAGAEVTFADAAVISALTGVAQLAPVSIGGIGVRELTIAGLGATLLPKAQADAAALTVSGAFMVYILVGGVAEVVRR